MTHPIYCENMKKYYMPREYAGLNNDFDKQMLQRHLYSCPECRERFEEMGKEEGIRNRCNYVKNNMYKFIRGLTHSYWEELDIKDHLERCKECKEFQKKTIKQIEARKADA